MLKSILVGVITAAAIALPAQAQFAIVYEDSSPSACTGVSQCQWFGILSYSSPDYSNRGYGFRTENGNAVSIFTTPFPVIDGSLRRYSVTHYGLGVGDAVPASGFCWEIADYSRVGCAVLGHGGFTYTR